MPASMTKHTEPIMKITHMLAAGLIATVPLFASGAAPGQPAATGTEAAAEKADAPKPMKPHSHMEEKTGMPQHAAPAAAPGKPDPAEDKTRHFHPRDMK